MGEVKLLRSKRKGNVKVRIYRQNQKAVKNLEAALGNVKLSQTRRNIHSQEPYIELEAQISKEIKLIDHRMERLRKSEIMNEDSGRIELIITRNNNELSYEITFFHRWHKAPPVMRSM